MPKVKYSVAVSNADITQDLTKHAVQWRFILHPNTIECVQLLFLFLNVCAV